MVNPFRLVAPVIDIMTRQGSGHIIFITSGAPFHPERIAMMKPRVPMQRFGQPKEVGALVAFLASGKCDFLSGQTLRFSGGGPGMA